VTQSHCGSFTTGAIEKCALTGAEHEVNFWRGYIAGRSHKYTTHQAFKQYFKKMIGDKRELHVADVGCGGLPLVGNCWTPDVKVHYHPSDMLADEYMAIWEELGLVPVVPIEKQTMERLTYPDKSMDIVFCSNAFDHCENPFAAIREMERICKPGGWVHLRHATHEGKRRQYSGLHKWNVDIAEDGVDCEIWNRTEKFLLSACVPGFVNELHVKAFGKHADGVISNLQKE